jgi:hypothetical protein
MRLTRGHPKREGVRISQGCGANAFGHLSKDKPSLQIFYYLVNFGEVWIFIHIEERERKVLFFLGKHKNLKNSKLKEQ